jgi:3-oxoacyl-[acyl-carrier-protein] synthase II
MPGQIVVTGLGVISPIGVGVSEFWKAAVAGRSGVSAIEGFDPFPMDGYRSKVAGQIHGFVPERYLDTVQAERVDRYAQFALVAAKEALADSGLQLAKENPRRIGVIVGAGMGGMVMGEREITQLYQSQRPHRVHPNFIPVITLNSASGIVAMAHGVKGPNYTISTACSSSAHALGQAMQCIREGRADMVLTVGADASITPLVFAGFCSLRALSTKYNDHPERASRPFDRGRDGFVMGEGAGALVLESAAHARKRKARVYAEVAGYAATSEAYHMVIPREDGDEIAARQWPMQESRRRRSITSTPMRPPPQSATPLKRRRFASSSARVQTSSPSARRNPSSGIHSERPGPLAASPPYWPSIPDKSIRPPITRTPILPAHYGASVRPPRNGR